MDPSKRPSRAAAKAAAAAIAESASKTTATTAATTTTTTATTTPISAVTEKPPVTTTAAAPPVTTTAAPRGVHQGLPQRVPQASSRQWETYTQFVERVKRYGLKEVSEGVFVRMGFQHHSGIRDFSATPENLARLQLKEVSVGLYVKKGSVADAPVPTTTSGSMAAMAPTGFQPVYTAPQAPPAYSTPTTDSPILSKYHVSLKTLRILI